MLNIFNCPGRFDFYVHLPAPAVTERGAILKHEIQKRLLQCSNDIVSNIASKCDGYDAYDLVCISFLSVVGIPLYSLCSHDTYKFYSNGFSILSCVQFGYLSSVSSYLGEIELLEEAPNSFAPLFYRINYFNWSSIVICIVFYICRFNFGIINSRVSSDDLWSQILGSMKDPSQCCDI